MKQCTGELRQKSTSHIFVSKRFQQQEQNGFEMFLPNSEIIFPCDLKQLQESSFPLLHPLVVVGELFQKISHQIWMVNGYF